MEKKLSKAQQQVVDKMNQGSKLIKIEKTWFPENVFFQNKDNTTERSNVKVIRKLLEKGLIKGEQTHSLVTEYSLNAE